MPRNVTFRAAAARCWICSTMRASAGQRREMHLTCIDNFSTSSGASNPTTRLERIAIGSGRLRHFRGAFGHVTLLNTDGSHSAWIVAFTDGLRNSVADPNQVVGCQSHLGRGEVLFQVSHTLRAGERYDVFCALKGPCDRQLCWGDTLLGRELLDSCHEIEVTGEILLAETRLATAEVVGSKHVARFVTPGEEPMTKRGVGYECNAQLPEQRQNPALDVSRPQ